MSYCAVQLRPSLLLMFVTVSSVFAARLILSRLDASPTGLCFELTVLAHPGLLYPSPEYRAWRSIFFHVYRVHIFFHQMKMQSGGPSFSRSFLLSSGK